MTKIPKPRLTRHGPVRSARFKKEIDKKLILLATEKEMLISEIIHLAVECLLTNKDCIGRKNLGL